VVDQLSYPQTVSVSDNDAYQRLLQNGLTYILNFPIKRAGAYQMRVAVRDGTSEQVGTATQFVEVPDLSKNQLALSGIVLSGIDQAAVSMTSTSAPAARPATIEPDPRTGPAVRRLSQGMVLDYRYHIYNAKLDAAGRPQLQTQMRLFRDDQQVFTGKVLPFSPTDQTDLKRLRMIGRLRIGPELTSGDYALQVIVIDNLAPENRRTTTQWIDFEILK